VNAIFNLKKQQKQNKQNTTMTELEMDWTN